MASLTFDSVGKTYPDGTVAVANVSFTIAESEFVVLVGPSGCGKSTLLRVAAGLEDINAGKLYLDKTDMSATEPQDRDIAMVFQNYALYPHMTVYENMAFGLQQRKMPKREIDQQVRRTAEMLDLSPYLGRRPGALSGGQRQRVAMGRAIVRHPAIFLMDEPLSNLDAKLRVQMRAELKLLNDRLRVTTLYVTHDQVEAMTMGDRVAVLKPVGGAEECNLQQIDTPQMLYDRPANLFVAGFIGSPAMNFLRAEVESHDGGMRARLVNSGQCLPLAAGKALTAHKGCEVVIGVRPEAFRVCSAQEALFNEPVPVTEALGADTYVFFDIASPAPVLDGVSDGDTLLKDEKHRLIARISPEQAPKRGEKLPLKVDENKIHVFDPASGQAIGN